MIALTGWDIPFFSGGDTGPFKAIEESILADLLPTEKLSATLAWYYMFGSWGAALGLVSSGWLVQTLQNHRMATRDSYRAVFWLYAAIGLLKTSLALMMSDHCETGTATDLPELSTEDYPQDETRPLLQSHKRPMMCASSISLETRQFLLKFGSIIIFDNIGTGLATDSWLTYFVSRKFSSSSGTLLGSIFSTCSLIVSVSNILAIPLVSRIGIIPTMLVGHFLASVALGLLPFPNQLPGAVSLLAMRAIFLDFDQAPRQTFLAQSVPSEQRTFAMGVINMIRTLAQSGGPIITGYLSHVGKLGWAFVLAGGFKWVYDLLLLVMFLERPSKS